MKHLIVPILALTFATAVYGQEERVATETRIEKQSATETGDRGLFTVPSAETLNKGQFSAGFAWSNTDRSPRDIDVNSLPVFFSFGVYGRLTVTGTVETQKQITARNLSQSGFNDLYPFVSSHYVKGIGDTTLSAKYRLKRTHDNIGGLALRGGVKFPTADELVGLGTGTTDVAADLIFTSLIPLNFVLDSDLGYTYTNKVHDPVTAANRNIKDQLRTGLGAAWPAAGIKAGGTLQGIVEYSTLSFVGAGVSNAADAVQNFSDVAAGVRYLFLDGGLTINAGYRTNTKFDFTFPGNKDRRGFTASISYTKPVRPPGRNRFPVISLETIPDEVRAGQSAVITATGFDTDGDQLTYMWSAPAGQISGSGDKVTFNTTGLKPGKYTVRATVSDGKGGTATSTIDVTVK
jgi:Big-like domain-containing protein/outer membrane putative beta-barrel porin/alpha-amylase